MNPQAATKAGNKAVELYSRRVKSVSRTLFKALMTDGKSKNDWIVDSGASISLVSDLKLLTNARDCDSILIGAVHGQSLQSNVCGSVKINGIVLNRVYYVPGVKLNIISVSDLEDCGYQTMFADGMCRISKDDYNASAFKLADKLYHLIADEALVYSTRLDTDELWHRRLGHPSDHVLRNTSDATVGLPAATARVSDCDVCAQSKAKTTPFPRVSFTEVDHVFDLIHMDLAGPINVNSVDAMRYFLVLVDHKSKYTVVHCLERKCEVTEYVKNFISHIKTQFDKTIKCFRTDNGTEFVNSQLETHLQELGIEHQTSVPYSPAQNGSAERRIGVLKMIARGLLIQAQLPISFWSYAVRHAVYLLNRRVSYEGKFDSI